MGLHWLCQKRVQRGRQRWRGSGSSVDMVHAGPALLHFEPDEQADAGDVAVRAVIAGLLALATIETLRVGRKWCTAGAAIQNAGRARANGKGSVCCVGRSLERYHL